ncbi:uncharacterized protein AB675_10699 [Cyphellophora attinorum]|uniref:Uncharacterized protein n=1 Tax=Cyphellophora attinorum TaxID=1664694 RepID=A0A0N1HBT5_9EURO|nr:uncharacterized protein AB675_10699 [Phialophora attinorum]KPI40933.1 hypothetical protein AB675_10699 [Phialophora attinorum]
MGHAHSKTGTRQTETAALVRTIQRNQFFTIDESQLLREVHEGFGPELERLKHAAVQESHANGHSEIVQSPSSRIFGREYGEVNRTLTGLLCLRWIYNDEYDIFTACQPASRRLCRQSFAWLRDHFRGHLQTPEAILLLVVSMIINDLGKDPNLKRDVAAHLTQTGGSIADQNHDSLLYEAAVIPGMIPCLSYLDNSQQKDLILGLELGSELNAGQLAQAENVPINLEFLRELQGREHAFELKFMEQILDVAGARGHINSNGSINLIQPVFEAFKTVHDVSLEIIRKNMPLRDAYDLVLKRRGKLLVNTGFRNLNVDNDSDRALLRLLTMGRTVEKDQAELFATAFEKLEEPKRHSLIAGLNVDGNVNEQAVLPYYMPAAIANLLDKTRNCTALERQQALTSLWRYLAKVFEQSPKVQFNGVTTPADEPGSVPGIVIEHNMEKVLDVINAEGFEADPDAFLDGLEIPVGQQLLRRRTSHSLASGGSSEGGSSGVGGKPSRTGTGLSALSIKE